MIESNFENLIKAYRKVHMTPEEKREVFQQSMLVIEKIEAVSLAHSDRSVHDDLYNTNTKTASGNVGSNWLAYIKKRQFIPALVSAFVLLFTGGTSLLADQALPGESLYSFKVNVNEPIRELAAVTTEARAKLGVEVTGRRLEEAAVLSAQGKLDDENKKIIQDQFVKQAGQIRNRVASLVASNNLNAAQEVVVDFESALTTHELILERLSLESGTELAVVVDPTLSTSTGSSSEVATLALNDQPLNARTMVAPSLKKVSGVSSLLLAVKSELDTTKTSRLGIEERVMATLIAVPASTTATLTTSYQPTPTQVIESNIKELRFTIFDIQNEVKTHPYATTTLDFVSRRMDTASSSIVAIDTLLKTNQITDAVSLSRTVLKNLAEIETVLKLEKSTGGTLEGKLNIATIIESSNLKAGITATTTATTSAAVNPTTATSSGTIIQ